VSLARLASCVPDVSGPAMTRRGPAGYRSPPPRVRGATAARRLRHLHQSGGDAGARSFTAPPAKPRRSGAGAHASGVIAGVICGACAHFTAIGLIIEPVPPVITSGGA
jgi:hypothetical protein